MPPHLHPRSHFTTSLFATTLFVSFFVVALPHALPCPAPRVVRADGEMPDGTPRRRRRRQAVEDAEGEGQGKAVMLKPVVLEEEEEGKRMRMGKRECPVPKPSGMVGSLLGFGERSSGGKGAKPP
ncbi:hypothetical protein BJ878DRAFT_492974 [Calycina marina]|uniref:Uncharacterized protein n=1 Tax=Calycina marina TaxID=1763456 RepID=A0A9P7Z8S3_9HELO|nr:hypothetical protein BJ878DRAFT_492974 [Calycina marina]